MKATSVWLETGRIPSFPALEKDLTVDVVVIGGGITGVTAAYLFKRAGLRVALLERARCGGVDTSYTTAHLTYVTDTRLHQLTKNFGRESARGVWEAGQAAMGQISANIEAEQIDCEFHWQPGYLHATPARAEQDRSSLESDAMLAEDLGFSAELVEAVPRFGGPGIRFPGQARFHPLKYLRGLLEVIPGGGSHVFEHTDATQFDREQMTVGTGTHSIRCNYIVLATHTPLVGRTNALSATLLQTKLYLYTTYALGARLPSAYVEEALYWDTDEPYHYLRVEHRRGFDYAIFGGEDHKTGQATDTEGIYRRLEHVLHKRLPEARADHRWSGQVVETNDGLPFLGETADRQFVATGFAGNGMTFGTLGAMMAVDACLGRPNAWAELFSPRRKKFKGATWHYLKENKDYPYFLVRDWLTGAPGKSIRALRRGQGKILDLNGRKVAACRDEHGKVLLCSPVCTHLKCIVAWNQAEQTWDCPCHGSRFLPDGTVMAGPAEENLEKIEGATDEDNSPVTSAKEWGLRTPFIP